jgi:hypothetical protein
VNVSYDVFSETNPAFCAYALVKFTKAFSSKEGSGPEAPIAYVALPIALSAELGATFQGTNKNTGLLEWLERSPQIQLALTERVNASLDMVTEAVRFGCFCRILLLDEAARLRVGERSLKKNVVDALSQGPAHALRRAERLGYWFAAVGSTRSVFDIMGLTV